MLCLCSLVNALNSSPLQVLNSGLRRLYTTETQCWIQPFFQEMSLESPALVTVSAAIQAYFDDCEEVPSVASMEHVDLALQTFRRELASRQESMHAATLCAGLLLCTLRVRYLLFFLLVFHPCITTSLDQQVHLLDTMTNNDWRRSFYKHSRGQSTSTSSPIRTTCALA